MANSTTDRIAHDDVPEIDDQRERAGRRSNMHFVMRLFRRIVKRLVPLVLCAWFVPRITLAYAVCGVIDVLRNTDRTLDTWERYFLGNGLLTWLLSPFNLLIDLLTLPHRNAGIYDIADLPDSWQEELRQVLDVADNKQFLSLLHDQMQGRSRVMLFFKWYGVNNSDFDVVPEFHRPYRYIRTIGVSAFSGRQTTSRHFGPLRVTLRVLYNIDSAPSGTAYIQVGNHVNRWCDSRLFIFDDTLMHQSVNDSDDVRYCMFIDILRPSACPWLLSVILRCVRHIALRFNKNFYGRWHVLGKQTFEGSDRRSRLEGHFHGGGQSESTK